MSAGHTETIVQRQSKGLLNEKVRPLVTLNNSLFPKLKWNNSKIILEFKGSSLKQDKITFTPKNVVNLFIVFELDRWSQDLNAGSWCRVNTSIR